MRWLLVTPDAFKGTFSALEVASAECDGIRDAGLQADCCPVADGGEGTMEILLSALGGSTQKVRAHDPLGRPIEALLGWLEDRRTAIVETAQASGLALVVPGERDAERASSIGTGELIALAAAEGARRIIVGVGGSATSDGGTGALEAIAQGGGLRGAELVVLCDVTTTFESAARVFGPQKGANRAAVQRLTDRLNVQAAAFARDPRGVPMTGAAGGLAGGLWGELGARLEAGAAWVLDAVAIDGRLARADAVIVGEGCLDSQSFEGKIVGEITHRCELAHKPVHAIVGSRRLGTAKARTLGVSSVRVAGDLEAIRSAARELSAEMSEEARLQAQ